MIHAIDTSFDCAVHILDQNHQNDVKYQNECTKSSFHQQNHNYLKKSLTKNKILVSISGGFYQGMIAFKARY